MLSIESQPLFRTSSQWKNIYHEEKENYQYLSGTWKVIDILILIYSYSYLVPCFE